LRIWKKSWEIGNNEICRILGFSRDKENDYIVVIQQLRVTIDLFEERAVRNKDVMKNLLKYSEQFKGELQEANSTIEQLDKDNERLRIQVRSAKKDLNNQSLYKKKTQSLKNKFKDEQTKLRESEKQKKDLRRSWLESRRR